MDVCRYLIRNGFHLATDAGLTHAAGACVESQGEQRAGMCRRIGRAG